MWPEKKDYVESINELVTRCNDISLLDLVFKLLVKSEVANA